ncbi:MAG: hypothetical protein AAB466_04475 [Verrucomicrobiota bacterium]
MNKLACFCIVLALGFVNAHAQKFQVTSPKAKPGVAQKKGPALGTPAAKKASSEIMERKVFYSGFLVELAKSEKPLQVVNLRAPLNPKRDLENVVVEPRTGRVLGFRLLSLDF